LPPIIALFGINTIVPSAFRTNVNSVATSSTIPSSPAIITLSPILNGLTINRNRPAIACPRTCCAANPITIPIKPPRATPAAPPATPPAIDAAKAPTPIILIIFLTAAAVGWPYLALVVQ